MDEELKITVAPPENGVLTIYHKYDEPYYHPQQVSISTNAEGLLDFIEKRRDLITELSVFTISEDLTQYILYQNPEDVRAMEVWAALRRSEELNTWNINQPNNGYSVKELRNIIRLHPHHFGDSTAEIIRALEGFKATFVARMEKEETPSGQKKSSSYRRELQADDVWLFDEGMALSIPLFGGMDSVRIPIQFRFEAGAGDTSGVVIIYLECPELPDMIDKAKKRFFDIVIKKLVVGGVAMPVFAYGGKITTSTPAPTVPVLPLPGGARSLK